jgi:hypothetical protein
MGGLERPVHHVEEVDPDRLRVHGVLELSGEARDGLLGVDAAAISAGGAWGSSADPAAGSVTATMQMAAR